MAGRLFLAALTFSLLLPAATFAQEGGLLYVQPSWSQLNAQQRTALAPLSAKWNSLPESGKQKWLGIARRYAALSPVSQARMQDRMREWIALTPSQREIVRNQFKSLRKAPQEQKTELGRKWQEYEALPSQERKRLAQSAPKTRISAIPTEATAESAPRISPYSAIVPKTLNQTPPGGGPRPLAAATISASESETH
jgi:hypothetical protein